MVGEEVCRWRHGGCGRAMSRAVGLGVARADARAQATLVPSTVNAQVSKLLTFEAGLMVARVPSPWWPVHQFSTQLACSSFSVSMGSEDMDGVERVRGEQQDSDWTLASSCMYCCRSSMNLPMPSW